MESLEELRIVILKNMESLEELRIKYGKLGRITNRRRVSCCNKLDGNSLSGSCLFVWGRTVIAITRYIRILDRYLDIVPNPSTH
jgi:hypothetical protein